jgi:hypothetical protein
MTVTPAPLKLEPASSAAASRGASILSQLAIFFAAFTLIASRRPDAIFKAQFWAEDGIFWYADAYRHGLHCLVMPHAGYMHTLPRLIGLLSLLLPLALAPFIMNLSAVVVQILPVSLFLSSRFDSIPHKKRLLASFLYLALPNSSEVHVNTTNIQWHLALLGCMILLAQAERDRLWRFFEIPALIVTSLTGPFVVLLVPLAALLRWKRKDARSAMSLAVLLPGAILQVLILFTSARQSAPNGATLARLVSILGGQVFMASLLGTKTLSQLAHHVRLVFVFEVFAMVAGLAIVLYSLRCAPLELRLFLLFAAGVLTMSLLHPLATNTNEPQWEAVKEGTSTRYFFLPMCAFLASLFWIAHAARRSFLRYGAAGILLLLLPIGICRDWAYPPFVDLDFREFATDFERAAPGTKMTIPINPNWQMELIKK